MLVPNQVDLSTVEPKGRVDVLAFKGAEWLVKKLEAQNGVVGVWDAIKPHVNQIVVNTITGMDIPYEVGIILSVIQANMQKKVGP
jgi:hypothetical protein